MGRIFFDTSMNISKVTSGICGRAFEYDSEGRIIYEENLDENQCITTDNKGYIGVKFEYDELSRLIRETYLDEKRNPMIAEGGFAITITSYEKDSFSELYYDDKGHSTNGLNGNYGVLFKYDERLHPISYQYLFADGISTRVDSIEKMNFYWNSDGFLQSLKTYDRNGFFRNAIWVLYDKRNLFILYSGGLDDKGQKTADNDGGYGQMFERDERGMVTGLWNINRYNQLSPSDDGISVWKIAKIIDGDLAKWLYFDDNRVPHADSNGAYGYELEYDDHKNETSRICLDRNGRPGPNFCGIQTVKKLYNDKGDLIEERYYDSHNKPCADEFSDYGIRYEHKFNPRIISNISIGVDGKPHNCSTGQCYSNAHFDEKSRIILIEYLEMNGSPAAINDNDWYAIRTIYNDEENSKIESLIGVSGEMVNDSDGIASTYSKYDELGRLILQKQYDKDGNLICDSYGDYGTAYEYSQDGREVSIISLDENGQIHVSNDGYAILRKVFDEQGREIELFYYDAERKPTMYQDYFGVRTIYTDQDNKFIYMVLDSEGKPLFSPSNGYYAIEKEMDNRGRLVHERYLDADLQPMASPYGSYEAHWTYNDEDNSVERSWLDIDGNVMEMANGIAYGFQMNDENGRIVFECYYDINHQLIKDDNGVFGTKYTYLEDGNLLIEYLDSEQKPMQSNLGLGAIYREFDDQRRQTFEMWLDVDGKPMTYYKGVYGWSRDFWDDGRILWTGLDAKRNPIPNEEGEISTLRTYDDEDREISRICLDAEGNPCPCNDGWIRRDKKYDEQGEEIEYLFYDAEGNPMADKDGDYGVRLLPVKEPNEEWIEYLGKDGKAHITQQGFASRYRMFDESGRTIKDIAYDKYRAPIRDEDGTYGCEYVYQEDGTELMFFLNEDSERTVNNKGVAIIEGKKDERGRITWYRRFDENGNPLPDDDGDYGFIRIYDDDSNCEETIGLNEDGKPHNNRFGWASHVIQYDELNRKILYYNVNLLIFVVSNSFIIISKHFKSSKTKQQIRQ